MRGVQTMDAHQRFIVHIFPVFACFNCISITFFASGGARRAARDCSEGTERSERSDPSGDRTRPAGMDWDPGDRNMGAASAVRQQMNGLC
eukprot:gene46344-41731_t